VRTVSLNVRWEERFRTSSKTRQRHELSGFVGEAVYEGDLDEFLPWITVGELVHLGKHTAWGMGQIELKQQLAHGMPGSPAIGS
jgi:CRISPR/Cas system endoribonuclease Cas6 (RAMP superfamily)